MQHNSLRNDGFSALIVAVLDGHTETVKALIDTGADVNVKINNGDTALIVAERQNYTKMVHLLKSAGAKDYP